ncbi:glycoside hydrolase family 32 protein [Nocardioides panacihumi]|uniref:beta-fructofuranosidase n=1 Tax=Nocardioides panacihumi TaxID=400774 RepID=A0ABN2QP33_9ACTN
MTVAVDRHLPAVHLRPPRHWVNDPNGLVFHDGWYHVFFQYNPDSARHANMHWGHVRSRDLVSWEQLPVALAPTPAGDDADGVWSGNAVSTDEGMVAFYSAKRDDRWWQPVAAATSVDGVTFSKRPGLLIEEPPPETVMFRDPYVWRDGGRWRMLVGAALADGRGAAMQYFSEDLCRWELGGPFLAEPPTPLPGGGDTEEGWECVQYADFGVQRGALVLSAWDPEEGAGQTAVYVGRDRGDAFEATAPQRFDHGPDFYAPALLHAPDGRWLVWGWVWEARDEPRVGAVSSWTDEVGWAGMLSLPRELTLTSTGVAQRPAREVDALRGEMVVEASGTAAGTVVLGEVPRCLDVVGRLAWAGSGRATSGWRLVTSADGREHLDIVLDGTTGELVVSRESASLDLRAKRGEWRLATGIGPGESVEVRAVLDHSVVEVFLATGEAVTARFYPVGAGPWRLEVTTSGTGQAAYAVEAWELVPCADPVEEPRG